MATASGDVLGQVSGVSTLGQYGNDYGYVGYNGQTYYVSIIKFKTPKFSGALQKITFNLWMYKGVGTTSTVRYAICTSDANKAMYFGTTAAVSDPNQVKAGTVKYSNLTLTEGQKSMTPPNANVEPDTTYYLIMWGYEATGISLLPPSSAWGNHEVVITYTEGGIVYIDNGATIEAYQVYIDNGTSWELYTPYIDNGTDWDLCG